MAIEITPAEETKKEGWQNILFIISIVLLIIAVGGFLALKFYFLAGINKEISEADAKISQTGTEEERQMRDELQTAQWEINDFKILRGNSPKVSNFFPYFESIVHPNVYFATFSLNAADNQVNLSGYADSFQTLIQQIHILQNRSDFIEKFDISNIGMAEQGGVRFDLLLTLRPSIFK